MMAEVRRPCVAERANSGPVIDTHAHWYREAWVRLIDKEDARHGGGATITRSGDELKFTGGGLTSAFPRVFVDLDLRLAAMDKQGVDMHALSLTTPMVYFAPGALALALSQAYNNAASAAHQKYPEHFVGMAMLPIHAPIAWCSAAIIVLTCGAKRRWLSSSVGPVLL